ncbi:MAG: arylsulfatase [Verrucomicrobiales bacterium]|nr:arylsulfatase [Verrucomicrobiota bacterium JB025]
MLAGMAVHADAGRPNILFILTDDQGYGDLECHGHPFLKTPNINKLHAQSTRFTDYQVSPTCAPTRAALMSGRIPFEVGVTHTIMERDRMALGVTTIAEVLKKAGYTTGIFGKWHLGEEDEYQPGSRGFDEVFIHGAGGIGQNLQGSQGDVPGNKYFNPTIRHNGVFEKTEGYCTDVFTRQTLGWIKQNKDKEKPFFAYLATNAPHGPYNVDEKYSSLYSDKVSGKKVDAFLGMITNIDENVGLIMEKLDEWGLAENTLLIFSTDNGSAKGHEVYNAGMKGKKGSTHEGGTRVPLFFRLPGVTKPGVDVDRLTRHIDLFPTLAQLAGADISELGLRGRSLWPLVKNPSAEWPDRYVFFNAGRWPKAGARGMFGKGDPNPDSYKIKYSAVRNERWRLVAGNELYDIDKDPGEENNVIAGHPEVAEEMLKWYDGQWKRVRPLMINEDAPLDVDKPFRSNYLKQKAAGGIPKWVAPEL